jgi:hypothetical protein
MVVYELARTNPRCRSASQPQCARLGAADRAYFSTTKLGFCSFFDNEAASLLGVTSGQVRSARYELERKQFMVELQSPGQKPRYGLRYGQPSMVNDDDEAA